MQKFKRAKEFIFKRYINSKGQIIELRKIEGISKNKVIIREVIN